MATTRTHVVMPSELLRGIDALVGKRGRSAFLSELAERELKRRKLFAFLDRSGPIWRSEDHPELKHGAAAWVSKMRREEERQRNRGRNS